MSTRTRIAITVASALALGVTQYGSTWTAGDPGLASDLWGGSAPAAYGFAIVAVFLVNRWWALLPVLAPTAAMLYLEYLTDYAPPFEREPLILPDRIKRQVWGVVTWNPHQDRSHGRERPKLRVTCVRPMIH